VRNLFTGMGGSTTVSTWRNFGLAALAIFVIAAAFHYTNAVPGGGRVVAAFDFAGLTVASAVALGFLTWGGLRLVQGADRSPDMKDTVVWVASLFGVAIVALAVLR